MKQIKEFFKKVFAPLMPVLRPVYKAWMKFAHVLGRINTAILLTLLYTVMFGVGRLFLFLSRKDILDQKWKDRESYWKKRDNFKLEKAPFLKPY